MSAMVTREGGGVCRGVDDDDDEEEDEDETND